ncbi:MAG: FtsX-like permease family protein [Bacteroidota bacterium]
MIRTDLKIAWRNLVKRKAYSSINVIGLAVGIATSILIFLVIHYEMNYEDFNSKKKSIYRIVSTFKNTSNGEVIRQESAAPITMANGLRNDIPQLEKVAAVWNLGGSQIHIPKPGKDYSEEHRVKVDNGLFFVEPSLFQIFDYTWLAGNSNELKDPNTVVINETLANQFFGDWKKGIGQTVQMWSFRIPLKVVGIFKDLPQNTDVEIRMGASKLTHEKLNPEWFASNDWESLPWSSECFVLLPRNSNVKQFEALLPAFVKKNYPASMNSGKTTVSLSFQPLTGMHLNEDFSTYKGDALTHKELWSLSLIAFFILFVACINFINLATAQSISRAKEIGVRKVLGSRKSQILKQFLNETAIITITSVIIGCLLAKLALPFISGLVQKPLTLNLLQSPVIILFLLLIGVIVNFLAGFYPGMVLSGFNPIEAIKSKISTSNIGGVSVRRGLVVLQFVIAQFLIIGTIVVINQMKFFRDQSMGFEKNALALVELPSDSTDQLSYNFLKSEIQKIPGINAAAFCMDAPASFGSNNNSFYFDTDPVKKDFSVNVQFSDTSYLNTFQIGLVAGRISYPCDTMRELLVNETLVRKLGFTSPKDIIGKTLTFDENAKNLPVVGVMKDFNTKSLKEPITPLVLATNIHAYNFIAFRMDPSKMQSTLAQVQKKFTKIYPTYMYDLTFLDERIARFYKTEALASNLFKIAAFLAIFISCLGLYGLVSFMAVQKTKEVGIRKVLGASVKSIVFLFSREFTILIGIAFLIAVPLGYFLMQEWLSGFHNHIKISWYVFVLAIVISVIIAWITVGYKAVRAGMANPVNSLKNE